MNLNKVYLAGVTMGCDPEFFFKASNGRVMGAERIIPETGLKTNVKSLNGSQSEDATFVIDGVQAELHPRPQACRAYLANEISACFKSLKQELDKSGKKLKPSFETSVKISKTELSKLDEKYQKLGCSPSKNSYEDTSAQLKAVDPLKHLQRSAGGHIHLSLGYDPDKKLHKDPDTLVKLLDIVCGNTCVLVDRDAGNVERRKLYGYAGEYRLPKHGLEYRTLSNFWLKSYPLMSLAFGLARLAVDIYAGGNVNQNNKSIIQALFDAVDMNKIRTAINTNDFDLAYTNFKAIEPILAKITLSGGRHPVCGDNIKQFHYFVQLVRDKGIDYWFPQDPLEHWTKLGEAHVGGFYDFLTRSVKQQMDKEVQPSSIAARAKKAA